jgi:putative two-component system response regulator
MTQPDLNALPADEGRKTILIVDDAPENLMLLGELLQPHFRVRAANSGARALLVASSDPRPDLVLLDVMMPEMDGYEVINRLKADSVTADIPVIFITAMTAVADEEKGLALGAVDYITKPFSPAIVLARVRAQLELKTARDRLANQNQWLEHEVARRMEENERVRDLSVQALACLAEVRDKETGLHIIRTQSYVEILGRQLERHPRFAAALADGRLQEIIRAAPLHDIGKIGIPDAILLKPDRLTEAEFEVMKTHSAVGGEAIRNAIEQAVAAAGDEQVRDAFDFLTVASEIAYYHHEKWDGSGYPLGLKGEDIPVSARLMALADVFDALSCSRVYKEPYSMEETIRIILEGRGTHFDPDVVDAFTACRERFIAVAKELADNEGTEG